MKYVLILGGEFPLRERVVAGAIRGSGGMPVVTLAKHRLTPWLKFFDDVISGDVMDPENVVAAVKGYEQSTGNIPAAVIPMNDFVVRSGLAVAEAYGLTYNSAEVVERCRDKTLMKECLARHDVPVPRFGRFTDFDGLSKLATEIGYPLVIKPVELAGSVGVIKVDTSEELLPAFEMCMEDIRALGGVFKTEEHIFQVEEYIPAKSEVSIEVINTPEFSEVLAVTEKYLGSEPYFVEVGHVVPSYHSSSSKLRQIATDACRALGIKYGVAHVEARITPTGDIRIIEVGARTGGDAIMDLVERAYGINPYELHIASHLGRLKEKPTLSSPRGLAAVGFMKAAPGVVKAVTPPQSVDPAVVNMQITAKPNDISSLPLSWKAREGSVELFWPGKVHSEDFREHLELTEKLTREIFKIEERA